MSISQSLVSSIVNSDLFSKSDPIVKAGAERLFSGIVENSATFTRLDNAIDSISSNVKNNSSSLNSITTEFKQSLSNQNNTINSFASNILNNFSNLGGRFGQLNSEVNSVKSGFAQNQNIVRDLNDTIERMGIVRSQDISKFNEDTQELLARIDQNSDRLSQAEQSIRNIEDSIESLRDSISSMSSGGGGGGLASAAATAAGAAAGGALTGAGLRSALGGAARLLGRSRFGKAALAAGAAAAGAAGLSTAAGASTGESSTSSSGSTGGSSQAGSGVSSVVNTDLPPEARAFLDSLTAPGYEGTSSYPNSGYNTIVGGKQFQGYESHPGKVGIVTAQGPSTAAGRYQFTKTTWNEISKRYGLTDFSPENQDLAAWKLAQERYKKKTGGDLLSALQSNDPKVLASVEKALSGTWSSLRGGVHQGSSAGKFSSFYQQNLERMREADKAEASENQEQKPQSQPTQEGRRLGISQGSGSSGRVLDQGAQEGDYTFPVTGDLAEGATSEFGYGRGRLHAGVDIYAKDPESGQLQVGRKAEVFSVASGKIVASKKSKGYGWIVDVEDENGIVHRYAHIAPPYGRDGKPLKTGDMIERGQQISHITGAGTAFDRYARQNFGGDVEAAAAHLDKTGWGSMNKPHLHYETRTQRDAYGKVGAIDPANILGPLATRKNKNKLMLAGYSPEQIDKMSEEEKRSILKDGYIAQSDVQEIKEDKNYEAMREKKHPLAPRTRQQQKPEESGDRRVSSDFISSAQASDRLTPEQQEQVAAMRDADLETLSRVESVKEQNKISLDPTDEELKEIKNLSDAELRKRYDDIGLTRGPSKSNEIKRALGNELNNRMRATDKDQKPETKTRGLGKALEPVVQPDQQLPASRPARFVTLPAKPAGRNTIQNSHDIPASNAPYKNKRALLETHRKLKAMSDISKRGNKQSKTNELEQDYNKITYSRGDFGATPGTEYAADSEYGAV